MILRSFAPRSLVSRASRLHRRSFYRSQPVMGQQLLKSLPCTFYRGGTSNGLLINSRYLPDDQTKWQSILSKAMGSPDTYGRQLNGMGSGISSTSKIMVVSPSQRPGVDVDYTFVQVGIREGDLDLAGNCGNMSSAVGPFALDEGMVDADSRTEACFSEGMQREVKLRLFNSNTSKIVDSSFAVRNDVGGRLRYWPPGDYSIDGIPGSGSKITLGFLTPGGAKTGKVLPTGNPIDILELPTGEKFQATLTDVANPGVFVLASELGVPGDISADELGSRAESMAKLEMLRQEGTRRMGLDPLVQSVPKIVLISSPDEVAAASGVNIVCRALSMQQAHRSVPLTLALNLGTACRIPGTLASLAAVGLQPTTGEQTVTIAHASGIVETGSVFQEDGSIASALLHRTARPLMKGDVFYIEEE